jgi:hypothetical protein
MSNRISSNSENLICSVCNWDKKVQVSEYGMSECSACDSTGIKNTISYLV